jgi:rod shape-determining protein MreC
MHFMNKIGAFLYRFNGFFAFIILEFFSIYLYFSQNIGPEKTAFLSSANRAVANVYNYSNRWMSYWNLSSLNDALAKENARLKMRLPDAQFSNLTDTGTVFNEFNEQRYQYTEAIVINNSVNRNNNYITLNRGAKHGVKMQSAVLNGTGEGVVGVIVAVSNHFSTAMSVLHQESRISAKIKRNGFYGLAVWNGKDPRKLTLEAIPKHAKIMKGDSIVTSGYSTIFPEGVYIGSIDTFSYETGTNFYNIELSLSADLNKLQYVYIVDDLMKTELNQLEGKIKK